MKHFLAAFALITFLLPTAAFAQPEPRAKSLDALLKQVKTKAGQERKENTAREAEFKKRKGDQAAILAKAKSRLAALEKRSEELESTFQENESVITGLEAKLRERIGTTGELFGIVRQVAGDTRSHVGDSLVSAQLGNRDALLQPLAQSKGLPSIKMLESLWYTLQQEATESGKVVRFKAPVVKPNGDSGEVSVVRVGTFVAVSNGRFVTWKGERGQLLELPRQPAGRHRSGAKKLEAASSGFVAMSLDPSRGSILELIVETPGMVERLSYGGAIGYIIMALGLLALGLALWRLTFLFSVRSKVITQQGSKELRTDNPLGRVLTVGKDNATAATETLELKLDEAILRESSGLDRFLWAIKVVSVAAPLLGLLGTVTGMIKTFQAITLFGAGDPKLMAGGISEALVTTMLGLTVAIPLVLLYSWITSMNKQVNEVLDEQSAGLVALQAEKAA